MSASIPPFVGTLPQWGAFFTLGALLAAVLRVLPQLTRARSDRIRAVTEADASAAEGWKTLEARVAEELAECRREREADAKLRRRLDDELFRTRIALSMAFDEIDRLDPGSDIVSKARAIMMLPAPNGDAPPQDLDATRLAELLRRLDRTDAKRPRGKQEK